MSFFNKILKGLGFEDEEATTPKIVKEKKDMFSFSEQNIFSLESTVLDLYGIPVEKHWPLFIKYYLNI